MACGTSILKILPAIFSLTNYQFIKNKNKQTKDKKIGSTICVGFSNEPI